MFPSRKELVQKHISIMLCKKMEMYVLSTITKCAMTIAMFEFWMCKIGFDTFVVVINFIDDD